MLLKQDFIGNASVLDVIKRVLLLTIAVLALSALIIIYIEELGAVRRDYEGDYKRYLDMGCAGDGRQSKDSKTFCESVGKTITYPTWVTAAINTVVRFYPCRTLHCSEKIAPILNSMFYTFIVIFAFAAFFVFVYYLCFGRIGWSAAASPQIIHVMSQPYPQYAYSPAMQIPMNPGAVAQSSWRMPIENVPMHGSSEPTLRLTGRRKNFSNAAEFDIDE